MAEFFCLRPIDAARLLRNREPLKPDLRTAQRTLLLLWKEGLVHRLPYFDLQTEGVGYVYGLSDKAIKNSVMVDFSNIHPKTFDEHSERTLNHELEITHFHMALKSFAARGSLQLYWQQADLKTKTIHPDAYFSIGKDEKWHHFFLEVERSRISNCKDGEPSIMRKLKNYYNLFDTDQCQKDWNFRQFRVIVVHRTDARCRNLCNALHAKYPHPMFWLTTEALCRADIGGEIFLTPKDSQAKSHALCGIF